MTFDFSTKEWMLGGLAYESPSELGALDLAAWSESVAMALMESPLAKGLPPATHPTFAKKFETQLAIFNKKYRNIVGALACDAILTPVSHAVSVEDALKGDGERKPATPEEVMKVLVFFLMSANGNSPNALELKSSGTDSILPKPANRSKTTARRITTNASQSRQRRA